MQKMLINATEEVRVAILDKNNVLFDLDIEKLKPQEAKKANIYIGRVTRVEPSLRAAFVDYGAKRQGFLPLKEIDPKYFNEGTNITEKDFESDSLNIKELIKEGRKVIVQIDKEERGNKGAALSTYISIAGRYMVLIPNNPKAGGISRRIIGEERDELRQTLSQVNIPENMGVIIRTAGVGHSSEDLQYDLDELLQLWQAIDKAASQNEGPCLLHRESDIFIRSVRDYSLKNINEIIIDNKNVYEKIEQYITFMHPDLAKIVKLYQGEVPLFAKYNVEKQIDVVFHNHVKLPSGGSIVIDTTEALTAIDVNSSQATKGGDIEETALNTNLEAAEEIARQLRIRDIGGLVVIDFIDMYSIDNQRKVKDKMSDVIRSDRARVQTGPISKFGLMELSRQRLRPSLAENTKVTCPRCHGIGKIRTIESISLEAMRKIEEEIATANCSAVQAFLPVDLAAFLANEKRTTIAQLESKNNIKIFIIPDPYLESPNFIIKRIEGLKDPSLHSPSYELIPNPPEPQPHPINEPPEEPLVQAGNIKVLRKTASNNSLLKRVWNYLFIGEEEKTTAPDHRAKQNMHKKHYVDYSIHKLKQEQRVAEEGDRSEPKILEDVRINTSSNSGEQQRKHNQRKNHQNRNRRRKHHNKNDQQNENQANVTNNNDRTNIETAKDSAPKKPQHTKQIQQHQQTQKHPSQQKVEEVKSTTATTPVEATETKNVDSEEKKHRPHHRRNGANRLGNRKRIYKKMNKNKNKDDQGQEQGQNKGAENN